MADMCGIEKHSVNPDDVQYALIIYGEISGIAQHLSLRRTSRTKGELQRQNRLKQVKCPHCATRFADTDVSTRIEVIAKPSTRLETCHLYRKCDVCATVFGINIVIVVS